MELAAKFSRFLKGGEQNLANRPFDLILGANGGDLPVAILAFDAPLVLLQVDENLLEDFENLVSDFHALILLVFDVGGEK